MQNVYNNLFENIQRNDINKLFANDYEGIYVVFGETCIMMFVTTIALYIQNDVTEILMKVALNIIFPSSLFLFDFVSVHCEMSCFLYPDIYAIISSSSDVKPHDLLLPM